MTSNLNPQYEQIGKAFTEQYYNIFDNVATRWVSSHPLPGLQVQQFQKHFVQRKSPAAVQCGAVAPLIRGSADARGGEDHGEAGKPHIPADKAPHHHRGLSAHVRRGHLDQRVGPA